MRIFHSLSPASGVRLFLTLATVCCMGTLFSPRLDAQFKFREPANRRDPERLGEFDGNLMWNEFLAGRNLGIFSLEGQLVHRASGRPSQTMKLHLEGDWRAGKERTRLLLTEDDQVLVQKEILVDEGEFSVMDLSASGSEPLSIDASFWDLSIHDKLPLTWGDMLMPFLQWYTPSYVGPTRYLGRPSHMFEVTNPSPGGIPSRVVLTIDEDFLALLRADYFSGGSKPVRRFRVGGFKQFGETWMFSELNWEDRQSRESMRLTVDGFSLSP